MMPLYVFVRGDVLGLVLLVDPEQSVAALIDEIQRAASVRVAPRDDVRLVFAGRVLEATSRVGAIGIEALDRVDLIPAAGEVA